MWNIGEIGTEENPVLIFQKKFPSGTVVGEKLRMHAIEGCIKIEVFKVICQRTVIPILKGAAMGNDNPQPWKSAQNPSETNRAIGALIHRNRTRMTDEDLSQILYDLVNRKKALIVQVFL